MQKNIKKHTHRLGYQPQVNFIKLFFLICKKYIKKCAHRLGFKPQVKMRFKWNRNARKHVRKPFLCSFVRSNACYLVGKLHKPKRVCFNIVSIPSLFTHKIWIWSGLAVFAIREMDKFYFIKFYFSWSRGQKFPNSLDPVYSNIIV